MQPPEDELAGAFFDPMDDYFGKVKAIDLVVIFILFKQPAVRITTFHYGSDCSTFRAVGEMCMKLAMTMKLQLNLKARFKYLICFASQILMSFRIFIQ